VKEDTASALRLFAEADPVDGPVFGLTPFAEEGEIGAAMALGELYGHRGEMEKSLLWVRKAAAAGAPEALFYLGHFYRSRAGGVKEDAAEANKLFRKAADGGYADAWLYLALNAAYGYGMESNFRQARAYLDSARSNGFDSRNADVALAAIGRWEVAAAESKQRSAEEERERAEEKQRWAEEERKRREEKQRQAEAERNKQAEEERQRAEEARQQAEACLHVYVGKTFKVSGQGGLFGMQNLTAEMMVTGFNPTSQRVSVTYRDPFWKTIETQEIYCSDIPR
jgi:TPR repeat protein